MRIAVFIAICQEDFKLWRVQLFQSLAELGFPVYWYADALEPEARKDLAEFAFTRFIVDGQPGEFSEISKKLPFKRLVQDGYDWAIQMDSDETWEPTAREALLEALSTAEGNLGVCPLLHVWEVKKGSAYVNEVMSTKRARIYRLGKNNWAFVDKSANGAYLMKGESISFDCPTPVIHWGFSTPELRMMHKERWDRIYTRDVGRNPYGIWQDMVDGTMKIKLKKL